MKRKISNFSPVTKCAPFDEKQTLTFEISKI